MRRIAFLIAFLLIASPAFAAENISYVRAGCTYNGDGDYSYCAASTNANGAYNSLSNWNTGEARTLTDIEHVYLYSESSAADTTFPFSTSSSWATSASNYVIWEAGDDHGGVWDDSVYHAVTSDASSITTMISFGGDTIEHIKIIGLQWDFTATSNSSGENYGFRVQGDSNGFEIHENIYRGNDSYSESGGNRYTWYFGRGSATSGTHKLWNNLWYNLNNDDATYAHTDVFVVYSVSSTVVTSLYNNTFIGPDGYGIYNGNTNSTVYSYNNGCSNCGALKNANVSGGTGDSTSTPTFVGGSDYHLGSSDVTWKENGTSDPGSGLYSDDVDGDSRPQGALWDTGYDELVVAGGGQIIMFSSLFQNFWRFQ